jgi:hypothetical protein
LAFFICWEILQSHRQQAFTAPALLEPKIPRESGVFFFFVSLFFNWGRYLFLQPCNFCFGFGKLSLRHVGYSLRGVSAGRFLQSISNSFYNIMVLGIE